MAEELFIAQSSREEKYRVLLPQAKALCASESNLVANLANMASALKITFDFFWIGFYLVENDELVLGPFQGPVACTRIAFGKGVCGAAWKQNKTVIVPDVDAFPGHIACSGNSKSEIVVPIRKDDQVVAVLDADSSLLNDFDQIDAVNLNELCEWLGIHCF
ncbi:GAF domain-containing protein [Fluviicola sp.]|jgi:GAF domain-containing protein|uniref:GAF domain-containing protein n=1 Tax=Fluviicola sp. TaxID=1917219 RepID=UPI00281C928E|nr:GAF domain-containing protein [Fluviicola sp.]MDR0802686.1 GAF domain-containing protein [Fluviicola sp.]